MNNYLYIPPAPPTPCPKCKGTGKQFNFNKCKHCAGTGKAPYWVTIDRPKKY